MERNTRRPARTGRPALKRFGQHFLEPAWVEKLVRAIAPSPTQTFLEIGPGRGALTRPLLAASSSVVAFEIDRGLAADLRAAELPRLTVVEGDFLDVSLEQLSAEIRLKPDPTADVGSGFSRIDGARLRVAGNLPYNVASPILFKLLDLHAAGLPIADATVMLQREVADRLLASPSTKEYGTLTVLIGHRAKVTRLLSLPPGAFRPAPKVHSTVLKLELHEPDPPVASEPIFRALVSAVFTRRRKTLANALLAFNRPGPSGPGTELSPIAALDRAGIDGKRRPETLSLAEFARLADVFARSQDSR